MSSALWHTLPSTESLGWIQIIVEIDPDSRRLPFFSEGGMSRRSHLLHTWCDIDYVQINCILRTKHNKKMPSQAAEVQEGIPYC